METNTIIAIRDSKNNLQEFLKSYRKTLRSNNYSLKSKYGNEGEYLLSDIIEDLKCALSEISRLTKSSRTFIKISTFDERNNIISYLSNIHNQLAGFQFQQALISLQALKAILRQYSYKTNGSDLEQYLNEIENIKEKGGDLEENLLDASEKLNSIDDILTQANENMSKIETEYENLVELKDNLIKDLATVERANKDFRTHLENANTTSNQIDRLFSKANSNEKIIKTFAEQVSKRQNQLADQEIKTQEFQDKMIEIETERVKFNKEAESLIKSAKDALKLKTAEGISAAFSGQYEKADKTWTKRNWLIGAAIFFLITLLLGVWILTGWGVEDNTELNIIIGRLALLPFTLLATLFCANQFVKQKSLAEDYAYKTVLAKSMIAFSEELREKNPDKYGEYVSSLLSEMLQDPMRKKGKEERDVMQDIGIYGKIYRQMKDLIGNQA